MLIRPGRTLTYLKLQNDMSSNDDLRDRPQAASLALYRLKLQSGHIASGGVCGMGLDICADQFALRDELLLALGGHLWQQKCVSEVFLLHAYQIFSGPSLGHRMKDRAASARCLGGSALG